jgi:hypothetical protein
MRNPSEIQSYRTIDHPIAQILAANVFYSTVQAFVADEWDGIYVDEAPSEDDIEESIDPLAMLEALMRLGLRFEAESPPRKTDPLDDDYAHFTGRRFGGGSVETLLYKWALEVMDEVGLDYRAMTNALENTDLIFVPDESWTVKKAYELYLQGFKEAEDIEKRVKELEVAAEMKLRSRSKG